MNVAIVTEGDQVSQHFGRSEGFLLASIEDAKVIARESVTAGGHDCGALPLMFRERQVGLVIAGGLGAGALQHLHHAGIGVIAGIQGSAENALMQFLAGNLQGGEATCSGHGDEHGHGHGHGEHGPCCH